MVKCGDNLGLPIYAALEEAELTRTILDALLSLVLSEGLNIYN